MTEKYDWSSFYNALCNLGPRLLLGIDDSTREMIEEFASSTDMFWSDGLQDLLAEKATNGDVRAGVLFVLELWRENVLQTIDSAFGIEMDWQAVSIDAASPLIDELVEAATPG
jgi:hypothetical protein